MADHLVALEDQPVDVFEEVTLIAVGDPVAGDRAVPWTLPAGKAVRIDGDHLPGAPEVAVGDLEVFANDPDDTTFTKFTWSFAAAVNGIGLGMHKKGVGPDPNAAHPEPLRCGTTFNNRGMTTAVDREILEAAVVRDDQRLGRFVKIWPLERNAISIFSLEHCAGRDRDRALHVIDAAAQKDDTSTVAGGLLKGCNDRLLVSVTVRLWCDFKYVLLPGNRPDHLNGPGWSPTGRSAEAVGNEHVVASRREIGWNLGA